MLSRDTSRAAEQMQVGAWRALTTVEIAELVVGASRAVRALALAGLRERYPEASEDTLIPRLAEITLGRELARRVYPELERAGERELRV